MAVNPQKSSSEEQFRFDESIFKPGTNSRVRLPNDEEVVYEEEQPFDQLWLWGILGFELIAVMIPLILTGQSWWSIVLMAGAMVMTMALLGSLKLYTRIDNSGIHFRMKPFHWKERMIAWDEIDQVHVRKYSPILEYGGWGIRYGRNGKAFNVRGNYGIQIIKKDGKKILLGTQKPDEVGDHLSQHPLLV